MFRKDKSEINIIYDINKENIKIFGNKFIQNNKSICKMIMDNKEYEITENFNAKNYNNSKLKIKLKGINNVINLSYMFYIVLHYYLYLIYQNVI